MQEAPAPRRARSLAIVALLVALGAFAATEVRATVMVEVPLEELSRSAHVIVRGAVTHTGTRMVVRGESLDPHTIVTIRVHEWLKGRGGSTLRLRELGGVGRLTALAIDGGPRYRTGEEVVVFAERTRDGALRTLALSQGRFRVRRNVREGGPVLTRDLHGLGFARFDRKGTTIVDAERREVLPLDELRRVVTLAAEYGGNDGVDLGAPAP
jgi:hypothetical protein